MATITHAELDRLVDILCRTGVLLDRAALRAELVALWGDSLVADEAEAAVTDEGAAQ